MLEPKKRGRKKGNRYELQPLIDNWRKKVYERDNYKCQMPGCNGTCKKLCAHHIKRWADCPPLRFVVSNGITLCQSCHLKVTKLEEDFETTFSQIVANKTPGAVDALFAKYGLGPT